MKEQHLQKKILDWLAKNGFWCFKTITCNKSGIMDIVACSAQGHFVGIEVKVGYNKPSDLQKYHIEEVTRRGGIAFVTWDLQTVVEVLTPLIGTPKPKQDEGEPLL